MATTTTKQLIHTPKIVGRGFIHIFYLMAIQARDFLSYFKAPYMMFLDLVIFNYYAQYYSISKSQYEMAKAPVSRSELSYGETPYFTLSRAMKHIPITKKSVFLDIGCGKGKLVLYAACRYGIRAAGIDVIPTYVRSANLLVKNKKIPRVKFIEKDFIQSKFQSASIVFVACTSFSKPTMAALANKLDRLKKGSHVISVSSAIPSKQFKVQHRFKGYFSWGSGTVYISKKVA